MQIWIIYTFIYAIFIGFFECSKKKAVEKNSIYEVLAYFSLIAFLLAVITCKDVFNIQFKYLLTIFIKSLVIVIAWLLAGYAVKRMPVSLYGMINASKVIFSILMSMIFLGEKLTQITIIGIIIVIIGLILENKVSSKSENSKTSFKVISVLLIACLLNACSGIIDKTILLHITSEQLQFWFLLFLTIMYWTILILKKDKINLEYITKNYWIPLAAICLVFGDKFLFAANKITESKVSIMTILKQISTVEIVILGKILFKEKNLIKKLLCCILVIFGIILTLI